MYLFPNLFNDKKVDLVKTVPVTCGHVLYSVLQYSAVLFFWCQSHFCNSRLNHNRSQYFVEIFLDPTWKGSLNARKLLELHVKNYYINFETFYCVTNCHKPPSNRKVQQSRDDASPSNITTRKQHSKRIWWMKK